VPGTGLKGVQRKRGVLFNYFIRMAKELKVSSKCYEEYKYY
jgi:hypothetical protein